MYFPPRNNKIPAAIQVALGAVFVLAILVQWFMTGHGRQPAPTWPTTPAQPASPVRPPASRGPTLEQLKAMLAPPADASRRQGVAVAVLVDTSGSMRQSVPDVGGGKSPKINIARRCLRSLVDQCAAFAARHPDKPLLLAVYEFSQRKDRPGCRTALPLGPAIAVAAAAPAAIKAMRASGDTPIGEAMIRARKDLSETGLARTHILVLTDGENNRGVSPSLVAKAIADLPEESRSSIYCVAFDVAESRFDAIRDAGGLVLAAGSGTELSQTLDYILAGKILAEQPEVPSSRPASGY